MGEGGGGVSNQRYWRCKNGIVHAREERRVKKIPTKNGGGGGVAATVAGTHGFVFGSSTAHLPEGGTGDGAGMRDSRCFDTPYLT